MLNCAKDYLIGLEYAKLIERKKVGKYDQITYRIFVIFNHAYNNWKYIIVKKIKYAKVPETIHAFPGKLR